MQNIIFNVIQDMSQFLSVSQLQELQKSLIKNLIEKPPAKTERSNEEYVMLFLEAKKIEGMAQKSVKEYGRSIRHMIQTIAVPVAEITTDQLRKYINDYEETHQCAKSSMDTIRRYLSSFFRWLMEEEYILRNPMARIHKIKSPKRVKTVLTDEDIERLRDGSRCLRDQAIIDFLYSTGMRIGELVKLNRSDIDFENRECIIFGKGSKERVAYFDAKAKVHLQEYLESRDDDNPALIVSMRKPHQRMTEGGIEKRMRELGVLLAIHQVHPHKFRRSMATKAIDKGMAIEQVQDLLGHADISTTLEYAMVSQVNVKNSHHKYIA